MATPAPRKLNIGSGRDFRDDCLNIDINDDWAPDIVTDVSRAFPNPEGYDTVRFGKVQIQPGTIELIVAHDVLEHVADLVSTMTTCLKLLKVGGEMDINVPYDLSFGAWQDPTHIRAFNERSWIYYTDWFWYLGWTEARFAVTNQMFIVSPLGEEIMRRGQQGLLSQTPRAVESMRVTLTKVELTADDRKLLAEMEQARRGRHAARAEMAAS